MAAKVSILILSLTVEGSFAALPATEQGSKDSSPFSSWIPAQGIQTRFTKQTAKSSRSSSLGTNLNDSANIETAKLSHDPSNENKSSNFIELSPSSPRGLSSPRQGPTKSLPNFPSFSTSAPAISNTRALVKQNAETRGNLTTRSLASHSSSASAEQFWKCNAAVSVKRCNTYTGRWLDFYMNIGGWIMLAVILCGILSLIFTHVQAKRQLRNAKDLPLLTQRYRLIAQHKARWI